MTLEEAKKELTKAGCIVKALRRKVERYRIAIYGLSIVICLSLVLHFVQNNIAKRELSEQVRLKKDAQHIAEELRENLRIAQDSIASKIEARREAVRNAVQAMQMYEAAVKKLKIKDSQIYRYRKTVEALEIQLAEKDGEMDIIAAKYQKKYDGLKARMEKYSGYGLDSLKFSYEVTSGDVRAVREGNYLIFSQLHDRQKYLVNIYPMGSPRTIGERISASMNGYIYIDIAGFYKKKDFEPPYVMEIQDKEGVIQWQYTVLHEMPEGVLNSETSPKKRIHSLSIIEPNQGGK